MWQLVAEGGEVLRRRFWKMLGRQKHFLSHTHTTFQRAWPLVRRPPRVCPTSQISLSRGWVHIFWESGAEMNVSFCLRTFWIVSAVWRLWVEIFSETRSPKSRWKTPSQQEFGAMAFEQSCGSKARFQNIHWTHPLRHFGPTLSQAVGQSPREVLPLISVFFSSSLCIDVRVIGLGRFFHCSGGIALFGFSSWFIFGKPWKVNAIRSLEKCKNRAALQYGWYPWGFWKGPRTWNSQSWSWTS